MSPRYRPRVSNGERNAGAHDYSAATAEQIDREVRKLLDNAYRLARKTLMGDRDKLNVIAKGLLESETLDSSQIKEILEHDRLKNPLPNGAPPADKKMPVKNALSSLGLTRREAEVLTWIAQGKTNYEIGVILMAGTRTVCKHVERILAKLSVENRTAAALVAIAALASARK